MVHRWLRYAEDCFMPWSAWWILEAVMPCSCKHDCGRKTCTNWQTWDNSGSCQPYLGVCWKYYCRWLKLMDMEQVYLVIQVQCVKVVAVVVVSHHHHQHQACSIFTVIGFFIFSYVDLCFFYQSESIQQSPWRGFLLSKMSWGWHMNAAQAKSCSGVATSLSLER